MHPVLFEIRGIPFYTHSFFTFLGLIAAVVVLTIEARRRKWPEAEATPITLSAFIFGMIGARLSILFLNGWETAPIILNPASLLDPRIGPGSILGGIIGAYLGGYVTSKIVGHGRCACDAFAPALAIAMAIGRFGCFFAGEDGLGKATTLPWGVQLEGIPNLVHPTPLYDSAFNFIWFGVLISLRNHRLMRDGNLLKFGIVGYAIFRFFIEFLRTNRVLAWGLTPHQFVCLGIVFAVGLYYAQKRLPIFQMKPA